MKFVLSLIVIAVAALVVATSFFPEEPDVEVEQTATQTIEKPVKEYTGPIIPISDNIELDQAKVALGALLFSDPILSNDRTVSCATCHRLDLGGSNGLPMSVGISGGIQQINVPTVFNSGLNFVQFWDGRVKTLEEQVSGPIENPLEMGSSWSEVIARIKTHAIYPDKFAASYPEGINEASISHAIAEFERSLITPNSAFDRHLKGEPNALSKDQVAGFQLFKELGCVRCHQGQGVGGNMFQRMGAKKDYFANRDDLNVHDMGRFNVTGDEFDRHRFKVPSLRNVALTAPYFHDGSAATLEDAVQTMVNYQLGRRLQPEEERLLVSFLNSLTGEYNGTKLSLGSSDQSGKKL